MLAVPSGINVINTVIADMFSLNADDTFVRLFLLFNEHHGFYNGIVFSEMNIEEVG